jgi:hypothetical protein
LRNGAVFDHSLATKGGAKPFSSKFARLNPALAADLIPRKALNIDFADKRDK